MARKDAYHDAVKRALEKDGWTITHDPLSLDVVEADIEIDLGAEQQPIAAEKDGKKIAVEIKSFVGTSDMNELEKATGQYLLYLFILAREEPDRELYLAIPETAYYRFFSKLIIDSFIRSQNMQMIVFNELEEKITQWIDEKNTKQS